MMGGEPRACAAWGSSDKNEDQQRFAKQQSWVGISFFHIPFPDIYPLIHEKYGGFPTCRGYPQFSSISIDGIFTPLPQWLLRRSCSRRAGAEAEQHGDSLKLKAW